jgi:hypothetical protein
VYYRNITLLQIFMKEVVMMGMHASNQRICVMAVTTHTDYITTAVLIKMLLHFLLHSKNTAFNCSVEYYTQRGSTYTLHQKCLQHY